MLELLPTSADAGSQVGLTDTDGWRSHCFSSILGGTGVMWPPMRPGALQVGGRWVMTSTTCVFHVCVVLVRLRDLVLVLLPLVRRRSSWG